MGAIYCEFAVSLDGFIAGPNVSMEEPMGEGGERLHDWMFAGKTEAETTRYEEDKFSGTGAIVMGRTMADLGMGPWGEDPVFHAPVFVVTHRAHEPIVKKGGTTYYFVTDGIESALKQARAAAGTKDISIPGGANIAQQYLSEGVIDEVRLHLVPILLGGGVRLFDRLGPGEWVPTRNAVESEGVVHLRYRPLK